MAEYTGLVVPSSAVSVDTGDDPWANPTQVFANDGQYSTSNNGAGQVTDTHYSYNYDFSGIPNTAKIVGIYFEVIRSSQEAGDYDDYEIYLMSSSSTTEGDNQATYTIWESSEYTAVYGGSTDLCGWTDVTVQDIKSTAFGLGFSGTHSSNKENNHAEIELIRIGIYYETTGGMLLNMGAF